MIQVFHQKIELCQNKYYKENHQLVQKISSRKGKAFSRLGRLQINTDLLCLTLTYTKAHYKSLPSPHPSKPPVPQASPSLSSKHTSCFRFKLTFTFIPTSFHSSCSNSEDLLYISPLKSFSYLCQCAMHVLNFLCHKYSTCPIFNLYCFSTYFFHDAFQERALISKASVLSIEMVFSKEVNTMH